MDIEAYARSVARQGQPVLVIAAHAQEPRRTFQPPSTNPQTGLPGFRLLRDVQIQIQYGFAAAGDLLHGFAPGVSNQTVLDVALMFHGPANPQAPDTTPQGSDPGGIEVHLQYQLNNDLLNQGRLTDQINLQGQIVSATWNHLQGSGFLQGSVGTGFNNSNQLGTMGGGAVGIQGAVVDKINDWFQLQVALQASIGIQDSNGLLQSPASLTATLTGVFDLTPGH